MDRKPASKGSRDMRRPAWLLARDPPEGRPARGLTHRLSLVAMLLGMIAALVGAGHLAAWLGGYLTSEGLAVITMKTNAALCLTLVGVALMLLVPVPVGRTRRWVARVCAAIAILVGLLTLMENLAGWNLGIDQLLAGETPGAMAVLSPNRMGLPASLDVTLIGLALWILSRRDRRGVWMAQTLALMVCLVGLLPTIGFLYGAREFYGIARYTAIAWPAALVLLLMGIGLLCARPGEGLMAQVTAQDPGGVGIRRLLPALVILPLLLGWLRLAGERGGLFDAPTGTGMMMLVFIITFVALTYGAGRRASRSAQALRGSEFHLARAQQIAHAGSWSWDIVQDRLYWSDETYRLFGLQPGEFVPRHRDFLDFVHPEDRAHVEQSVQEAFAHDRFSIEYRVVRKGGEQRYVHSEGYPAFSPEGRPMKMEGIVQDITERRQAEDAIKWSARRHEVLSQTAARLLQSDHPQGLVEELCRQVMDFLDCHAFFNFLMDEPSGRLRLNACAGIPPEEVRELEWLDCGVAVCGCVARDGVRIIAEDIQNTPDPRITLVKSYGIQAYCCHPLRVQDRLIGTLSFGTRARPRFSPEEIEVMKAVTDLVAMAMHRLEIEKALRELNTTLESKVVQRTAELAHRARQLQKLTLELSQAEERERRRIAVILHEDLQQQIAGARFHLSLVRHRARDDQQRACVDKVDAMLNETIEKSRSLSYDLSPAVVHINDLAEVLQWLAKRVRTQHGLMVDLEIRGDMNLHSEALAMFLFRAAQEMLFNVTRHAHVREAILRVRRIGRHVCLAVADQGPGFDPQALRETAGVGLFSIRERVELLGGRMQIKSAPGRGSRFRIVVLDGLKSEDRRQKTEDGKRTTDGQADLSFVLGPPPSGPQLRVLLVDDHDIVREGLAALLQEVSGVEVVGEAADGREAVNLATALRPDVVIMDVSMPLMSGDEATRQIKTHLPQTRVIALSMYDEADKKERMYQAGAQGYVLKTASSEELLAALHGGNSDI